MILPVNVNEVGFLKEHFKYLGSRYKAWNQVGFLKEHFKYLGIKHGIKQYNSALNLYCLAIKWLFSVYKVSGL